MSPLKPRFLELIHGLRDELGTAILYISHDLGVVAQLCDRVIVMYAGNIVEQAMGTTIFDHPEHPYTQALLAAHPSHKHHRERLLAISGRVPSLKDLPPGCKFADRCAYVKPLCNQREPVYTTMDGDHSVLCHRLTEEYGEVLVKDPLDATIALPSAAVLVRDASPDQPVLVKAEALHMHFRDRVSLLGQLTGQRPGYLRAVNGIDLNIRRGETVGLVGELGSGKTTLGKTLLRLI